MSVASVAVHPKGATGYPFHFAVWRTKWNFTESRNAHRIRLHDYIAIGLDSPVAVGRSTEMAPDVKAFVSHSDPWCGGDFKPEKEELMFVKPLFLDCLNCTQEIHQFSKN